MEKWLPVGQYLRGAVSPINIHIGVIANEVPEQIASQTVCADIIVQIDGQFWRTQAVRKHTERSDHTGITVIDVLYSEPVLDTGNGETGGMIHAGLYRGVSLKYCPTMTSCIVFAGVYTDGVNDIDTIILD